ncbi:uncharacterized protein LOC144164674 [Haemaphysalis longicornis]
MAPPRETEPPAAPPSTTIICSGSIRQRDPPFFNGQDEQDVEDWLATYDRVSAHNNWGDNVKRNNVEFYLTGTAELWYGNHGKQYPTWSEFKSRFSEHFGRPSVRKLHAEQRLRERAQQPGESFLSYIEEVVDLCRRVTATMSDEDTIKHILKGISDDAFQMLLAKNPQTVTDVINLCQSYDELRRQRALTRRSVGPDVSSLTAGSDNTLSPRIQQFIREEVARQLSLVPFTPTSDATLAPSFRSAIQQQVADTIPCSRQHAPVTASLIGAGIAQPTPPAVTPTYVTPVQTLPVAGPLTYADAISRPFAETVTSQPIFPVMPQQPTELTGRPTYPSYLPMPPVLQRPPRVRLDPSSSTTAWRTPDNRPICFVCLTPGHVARYCRRGGMPARQPSWNVPYVSPQSMPRAPTTFAETSPPANSRDTTNRHPSPRRRSLSPMRRRPLPPEAEN